jgi:AcrR family transcriptional regulator
MDGALQTIREAGVRDASARTIAARADVNQALVFYHFGSVDQLLAEACRVEATRRVESYRTVFDGVTSLRELLDVGRRIHAEEVAQGNVNVLAQMLASAHANDVLRESTKESFGIWVAEIEFVLRRVLAGSALQGLVQPRPLAQSVAASFIGIELFEQVDPDGASRALEELDRLAVIAEVFEELGPVARRAVRARLSRRVARVGS